MIDIVDEEVEIFKVPQEWKIDEYGPDKNPETASSMPLDAQGCIVIYSDGQQHDDKIIGFTPRVENQTRRKQYAISVFFLSHEIDDKQ